MSIAIFNRAAIACALFAAADTVALPPVAPRPAQSASQAEVASNRRDAKRARKAARDWWRQ